MVEFQKWNVLELFIGRRGHGKTTIATAVAQALQRGYASYVLAHDPGLRIHGRVPPGFGDGAPHIHRHASMAALKEALRYDTEGVHTVRTPTADPLLKFAIQLGRHSLVAGGGREGDPVYVWVNEATACLSAGAQKSGTGAGGRDVHDLEGWETDPTRWLATQGRHEHCGIGVEVQTSRFLTHELLSNATAITCVRTTDEEALERLRSVAGFPEAELENVRALPKYHAIRYVIDDGDVPLDLAIPTVREIRD